MKKYVKPSTQKNSIQKLIVVGIAILLLGFFVWYQYIYSNAERTFWGMIDNSLKINGVTRQVEQQTESGSFKQYLQLEVGVNNVARSLTTLDQKDEDGINTHVTTESVGTQDANFSRYTAINTPGKVNFDNLINIWGKEVADEKSENQSVLSEAVFGVVPFAKLSRAGRAEVINFARENDVYAIDFTQAKRSTTNGKKTYTYNVEVNTVKYIEMLKIVDRLIGLDQLSLIDPSSYANAPVIPVELSVAIDSRQLIQSKYDAVNRTETFSGYGIQPGIIVPTNSIDRSELEKRLQDLLSD